MIGVSSLSPAKLWQELVGEGLDSPLFRVPKTLTTLWEKPPTNYYELEQAVLNAVYEYTDHIDGNAVPTTLTHPSPRP